MAEAVARHTYAEPNTHPEQNSRTIHATGFPSRSVLGQVGPAGHYSGNLIWPP